MALPRATATRRLRAAADCAYSKLRRTEKGWRFSRHRPTVAGMITILSAVVSILGFRLRRRASLEVELIALRHQVSVLRRRRTGRIWFFSTDRLLWVWLYRAWPRCVAPARPKEHAHVMVCSRRRVAIDRLFRNRRQRLSEHSPDWVASHRSASTERRYPSPCCAGRRRFT